jgi:GNAT superfamily N-acetyltransferase
MLVMSPQEASRPATVADLPRLAELAQEAVDHLRPGRGGEVWARRSARHAPFDDALARELADDHHHVVVGTVDGVVMGYGVAGIEVLRDGGRLGVVTDLYTDPGCREIGLGELVMEALVHWCGEHDCFGVDSLALPGDRHTKNFFESFGLVARAIVVHRPIP